MSQKKSSSGVEKPWAPVSLPLRDLFGDNEWGENRPLLGLAPIWEIKQLQPETALEKIMIEHLSSDIHKD